MLLSETMTTTITPASKIQLGAVAVLLGGIVTIIGMVYNLSGSFVSKELFTSELNSIRRETTLQFDTVNRRLSDLSSALDAARKESTR